MNTRSTKAEDDIADALRNLVSAIYNNVTDSCICYEGDFEREIKAAAKAIATACSKGDNDQ